MARKPKAHRPRAEIGIAGALLLACAGAWPLPLRAQEPELQARVWLARGPDAVLERGDREALYYRSSRDAYVAIFQIDTDGIVRLLHPRVPDQDYYVRGGQDYRLLFPRSPDWQVDDDPGVGYFFVIASDRPMDFSAFHYSRQAGDWDLSSMGGPIHGDPYTAMDDYGDRLVPRTSPAAYALDFAEYHVGRDYEYPRFLCYQCHGFRPYRSWNPYDYACRSFRLVIYTDPYFYPVTRYRGSRVVYTRPPVPREPRFAFRDRRPGEADTPIHERRGRDDGRGGRATAGRGSGSDSPPVRRAVPRNDQGTDRSTGRRARPRTGGSSDASGGAGSIGGRTGTAPTDGGRKAVPRVVPAVPGASGAASGQEERVPRPVLRRRTDENGGGRSPRPEVVPAIPPSERTRESPSSGGRGGRAQARPETRPQDLPEARPARPEPQRPRARARPRTQPAPSGRPSSRAVPRSQAPASRPSSSRTRPSSPPARHEARGQPSVPHREPARTTRPSTGASSRSDAPRAAPRSRGGSTRARRRRPS